MIGLRWRSWVVACLAVVFLAGPSVAQFAPDFAYLVGTQYPEAASLPLIDKEGNSYVAGQYRGTVDLDPGPGTVMRTSGNSGTINEGFIVKFDVNGDFVYVRTFPGYGTATLSSMVFAPNGDLLVAGTYTMQTTPAPPVGEELDFDPGISMRVLPADPADQRMFLLRLTSSGEFVSTRSWGSGSTGDMRIHHGLRVDRDGNIYLAGDISGGGQTFDLDPGPGVQMTPPITSFTLFYIIKLDRHGDFIYGQTIGGPSGTSVADLEIDVTGNSYLTGSFQGTVDFDPGAGVQNLTAVAGAFDSYVLKLDPNGNFLDVAHLVQNGASTYSMPNKMALDLHGNVFVTGQFEGTADFDPSGGTLSLTTPGAGGNMFVSKLDSSLNLVYAKRAGGNAAGLGTQGMDIEVSRFGDVYISGLFYDTVDFDPDGGVVNLVAGSPYPGYDGFLLRLNEDGTYNEAYNLNATDRTYVSGLHLDASHQIHLFGRIRGTADFDPSAATYLLTSPGAGTIPFFAKMVANPSPTLPNGPYVTRIEPYTILNFSAPVFRVDFNEPVTGFDATDLTVSGTTGATIYGIQGSGTTYFVGIAMSPVVDEIVRLNIVDNDSIVSTGTGMPLGGAGTLNGDFFDGGSIIIQAPGVSNLSGELEYANSWIDPATTISIEDVVADSAGNSFVVGDFEGAEDIDPGPGSTLLTSAGDSDSYIAKYDVNGNLVFARSFGGLLAEDVGKVRLSSDESTLYILGSFEGTVDFDPGAGTQLRSSAGQADLYVLQLDQNGNWLDVSIIGGTGEENVGDLFVDRFSNIYIGASYNGAGFDADPGPGTLPLPTTQADDVFMLRIDTNGDVVQAYHAGSTGDDYLYALEQDGQGRMYLLGDYENAIDVDPSAATVILPAALGSESFLVRLASDGSFIDAAAIVSANPAVAANVAMWDLELDALGNAYFCGSFEGVIDFDPAPASTHIFTTTTDDESFVVKLDRNLDFVYAERFEPSTATTTRGRAQTLAVGRFGDVMVGGRFQGPVDFDPGVGVLEMTPSGGGRDGFLSHLNPDGSLAFAHQLGATNNGRYTRLFLERRSGRLYTVGRYDGAADVAPGETAYTLPVSAASNFFAVQLQFDAPVYYLPFPLVQEIKVKTSSLKGISTLVFEVTFTADVTGVDVTDFVLTGTGIGTITGVTGSGNVYEVSVTYDDQSGPLFLDLVDDDSIVGVLTGVPLGGAGSDNGDFQSAIPLEQKGSTPTGLPLASPWVLMMLMASLLTLGAGMTFRGRHHVAHNND